MNAPVFLVSLFGLFFTSFLTNLLPVSANYQNWSHSVPSMNATAIVNGDKGGRTVSYKLQQQKGTSVDTFFIHSDIRFRYSRTKVTSSVVNPSLDLWDQVKFNVKIPDTAFISKFSMRIGNETFDAKVAKREEETFSLAAMAPKSAAFVEQIDANLFTVSANVGPDTVAVFTLIYEELLERRLGLYEQVIHIDPDTVRYARDYKVSVSVADSRNLTLLRAIAGWKDQDPIDNEIPGAKVQRDGTIGLITWTPDANKEAIPKKFILHYDIDHPEGAGQVLVRDGYFVHFFSPQSLPVQPKHAIFVLDISASMQGARLSQLKAAMSVILKDLSANHKKDYFSIITFHSKVTVWNGLPSSRKAAQRRPSFPVTPRTIRAALSFTEHLQASGSTNIHGALITALNVAAAGTTTSTHQHNILDPIIIFLTEGNPTEGVTSKDDIQKRIAAKNVVQQVPIFSVALGEDLDFAFLRSLSLQNGAMARRIYDGSDTALQLEKFHGEISWTLSSVSFTYTSDMLQTTEVTRTTFSRFFKGTEIIVAGKVTKISEELNGSCNCDCVHGSFVPLWNVANSTVEAGKFGVAVAGTPAKLTKTLIPADVDLCSYMSASPSGVYDVEDLFDKCGKGGFMERFWAFMRIKQLIEQAQTDNSCLPGSDLETPAQHALDLALEYGFVTPLTSLVLTRTDLTREVVPLPYKGHTKLLNGFKGLHPGNTAAETELDTRTGAIQVPTTTTTTTIAATITATAATTTAATTTAGTPVASTTTAGPSALTLKDISWLRSDGNNWIQLNDKDEAYFVPTDAHDYADEYEYDDLQEEIPNDGVLCNSRTCAHLRDCIMPEFINDFEVYMEDYFCHIKTPKVSYAGACCSSVPLFRNG